MNHKKRDTQIEEKINTENNEIGGGRREGVASLFMCLYLEKIT